MAAPVFMMLFNSTGPNAVAEVEDYISEKVHDYIASNEIGRVNYIGGSDNQEFTIKRFDGAQNGLTGNYDDFFVYAVNGSKDTNIISINETKLRNFCAYINRLTT
jgi:hypothetical protein